MGKRQYSHEDALLAVRFAVWYAAARESWKKGEPHPIRLTRKFAEDKDILARHMGHDSYRAMPADTKSLIGMAAAKMKKQKKELRDGARNDLDPFELVLRDVIADLTKGEQINAVPK